MSIYCAKISPFSPHNNSVKKVLLLFLFHRLGNIDTTRSADLFKVTELIYSGACVESRQHSCRACAMNPFILDGSTWASQLNTEYRVQSWLRLLLCVHTGHRFHNKHGTLVDLYSLWLWKLWFMEMSCRARQTHHFLGRTVRLYCKIPHLNCWGQSGWIQWGRHKRRWHERCCRGWISEILATDWMVGMRKAGEAFFWNSELNDKHKCNYIVKVESSRGRQIWFPKWKLSLSSWWMPLGKSLLCEHQYPCQYSEDPITFLP